MKLSVLLYTLACALSVGCGGGGDCAKAYEMMNKCDKPKDDKDMPSKELFVAACREEKEKNPKRYDEAMECQLKDTCDDIKKCEDASRDKRRAERAKERSDKTLSEVKANITAGKYSEVMSTCEFSTDERKANADLEKTCASAAQTAVTELSKKVTADRDAGKESDFQTCYDLKKAAEKVGAADKTKAEALCGEAEVAGKLAKTLTEVNANIAANKDDIPFECDYEVDAAIKLKSEWAAAKAKELSEACYVKLGGAILTATIPKMEYCDYKVVKVFKGYKKYNLKNDDIDKQLATADKACKALFEAPN